MKHDIVVKRSEEDEAQIAESPDLPGCMAHGLTPTEAVREVETAAALWLETARLLGRPSPQPDTGAAKPPVRV